VLIHALCLVFALGGWEYLLWRLDPSIEIFPVGLCVVSGDTSDVSTLL